MGLLAILWVLGPKAGDLTGLWLETFAIGGWRFGGLSYNGKKGINGLEALAMVSLYGGMIS